MKKRVITVCMVAIALITVLAIFGGCGRNTDYDDNVVNTEEISDTGIVSTADDVDNEKSEEEIPSVQGLSLGDFEGNTYINEVYSICIEFSEKWNSGIEIDDRDTQERTADFEEYGTASLVYAECGFWETISIGAYSKNYEYFDMTDLNSFAQSYFDSCNGTYSEPDSGFTLTVKDPYMVNVREREYLCYDSNLEFTYQKEFGGEVDVQWKYYLFTEVDEIYIAIEITADADDELKEFVSMVTGE